MSATNPTDSRLLQQNSPTQMCKNISDSNDTQGQSSIFTSELFNSQTGNETVEKDSVAPAVAGTMDVARFAATETAEKELGDRLAELNGRIDQFSEQLNKLDARFNVMNARLDSLDQRVDAVAVSSPSDAQSQPSSASEISSVVSKIESRFESLENIFKIQSDKVNGFLNDLSSTSTESGAARSESEHSQNSFDDQPAINKEVTVENTLENAIKSAVDSIDEAKIDASNGFENSQDGLTQQQAPAHERTVDELKRELDAKLRQAEVESSINRARQMQERVEFERAQAELDRRTAELEAKLAASTSQEKTSPKEDEDTSSIMSRFKRHLGS